MANRPRGHRGVGGVGGVRGVEEGGAESGAVTIAGSPAAADMCFFQINRDISADTQTGDARLLGVKLLFTTDAANDA